jgi:hypothetical protein
MKIFNNFRKWIEQKPLPYLKPNLSDIQDILVEYTDKFGDMIQIEDNGTYHYNLSDSSPCVTVSISWMLPKRTKNRKNKNGKTIRYGSDLSDETCLPIVKRLTEFGYVAKYSINSTDEWGGGNHDGRPQIFYNTIYVMKLD